MSGATKHTRLLEDIPRPDDAFGSHSRVAASIAHLIGGNPGGKAIALEGSWGSGKSTIVSLLGEHVGEQVFVFDAWAHDRDPLRRVFLEELIEFFWERLNHKKWRRILQGLSRRRRVTETQVTPHLTLLGGLMGIVTLLLPASAAFLAAGMVGTDPNRLYFWLGLAGTVAIPAGLVLALVISGGGYLFRRYWKKDLEARQSVIHLALFLNRETHDQRTETIEDPEPTSVEFARIFNLLLTDALKVTSEPFLLVVDNLDRVPRHHALSVWTALRVYIEECNAGKRAWCPKTWLLVPYDRPALEYLWAWAAGPQPDSDEDSDKTGHMPDLEPRTLSESFLQKTFHVRFRVPPVLLTDWKGYFGDLLKQAFPDHPEEGFHAVYRCIYIWRKDLGQPPTPRHLKLFVNDLVALHGQGFDEFPLAHLAYYLVLNRREEDVERHLREGSVPEPGYAEYLSDEIWDDLAALHYSRDVDQARQLALEQPIRSALDDVTGEKLRTVSTTPGFWDVFVEVAHSLVNEEWQSESNALSNAAQALHFQHQVVAIVASALRRNARSVTGTMPEPSPRL